MSPNLLLGVAAAFVVAETGVGPSNGPVVPDAIKVKARPFDLKEVRLLEGPFEEAIERTRRYLHSLDSDRQLHTFRITAGLPSTAKPLGGWEAPDNYGRGEFFGHYLSACAMIYAMTGDEKLKAKADALVAELAKCQEALGPSGYLNAEPESYFDRLEAGQFVQGTYYTIHKLMAGLLDLYTYCDNRQALEVAKKLAGWVRDRTRGQTVEHFARVWHPGIHVEYGGLNEALLNLYAITGDPDDLATARRFDDEALYRPLAKGLDQLAGLHVNTQIPKIIGAARAYELTGEKRYRDIAEFFWRQVADARSYGTGGTSNYEHWRTEPGRLAAELSPQTQECCCTYNMLKLARHVFTWTADCHVADYYERALFNGILGTQNPETGLTMYYVPLASGYWKTFASPLDSFWCCTGTGVESFSKLGDSIYFRDEEGVWVNLFIASELTWPEKGLRIRQETRFPEQEGTTLVVSATRPVDIALRVRVPYWAPRGVTFKLNDSVLTSGASPGSYAVIRRTWSDGDRLEVAVPMGLHAHPMPDDNTLTAVMYGPLVLVGRLGTDGLTSEQLQAATPAPEGSPVAAPWFVTESDDLNAWIKPVPGKPLAFATQGQSREIVLVPFYKLFGERYAVYWRVYRKGSREHKLAVAREEAHKELAARTIDRVEIGDARSEAAHGLAGERTQSGAGGDRHWRHAVAGGWFSYRMRVLPEGPITLLCTYWGDDAGARTFDVLIDGVKVTTQQLEHNAPGEFFDVELDLAPELTRGKGQITVRFQAHPDNIAGGVFGCATLKARK
jgi:DUF1680 family protein